MPYVPAEHGVHVFGATPKYPCAHERPQVTPYSESARLVSTHLPLGGGHIVRSVGESQVSIEPTTRGLPSVSGVRNWVLRMTVVAEAAE